MTVDLSYVSTNSVLFRILEQYFTLAETVMWDIN